MGPEWEMERGGNSDLKSQFPERKTHASCERGEEGWGRGCGPEDQPHAAGRSPRAGGARDGARGGGRHPSSSNSGEEGQDALEVAESPRGCPTCPAVGERRGGNTGRYQDCF